MNEHRICFVVRSEHDHSEHKLGPLICCRLKSQRREGRTTCRRAPVEPDLQRHIVVPLKRPVDVAV